MPTYEYKCGWCGHDMEEYQSMTAKPLRKCPQCGKLKLERKIGTGAAVLFKGSGFYQTDYRTESYKKGADAEKGDKKPVEAKGESKSGESKSETKKESKAETKAAAPAKPEKGGKPEKPKPGKSKD